MMIRIDIIKRKSLSQFGGPMKEEVTCNCIIQTSAFYPSCAPSSIVNVPIRQSEKKNQV